MSWCCCQTLPTHYQYPGVGVGTAKGIGITSTNPQIWVQQLTDVWRGVFG